MTPLDPLKKEIMISKVTSDQKLHGKAWNRRLCLPHAAVHAPHNMLCVWAPRRMKCCISNQKTGSQMFRKQTRNHIYHICQAWKKPTVSLPCSEKFSQQKLWRSQNSASQKDQESHQTKLKVPKLSNTLNSKRINAAYDCAVKRLHSTLQPRLSASSFNSLMDLSLEELPQVFHVTVASLWWHRHAIECFSERLRIDSFLIQKWKNMHHNNLCPFLHWPFARIENNKGPFPQGHCSRDAAARSSTEQGYKDLTRKYSQYMQTESKSWKRTKVLSDFPYISSRFVTESSMKKIE